jgi:FdhD protein
MAHRKEDSRAQDRAVRTYDILCLRDSQKTALRDPVAVEVRVGIVLNGEEVAGLLCSPRDEKYLAAGFLRSEGLLSSADEIESIRKHPDRVLVRTRKKKAAPKGVRLLTSGCGAGITFDRRPEEVDPVEDLIFDFMTVFSRARIAGLMKEFLSGAETFKATGGTHIAALSDGARILFTCEDIGRHNAVDKVLGRCFLERIDTHDKLVLCSGRMSSEIVRKAHRCGIPVVVSRSAPTSLAIDTARRCGVTLVGFARGERMNVYSFPARIAA